MLRIVMSGLLSVAAFVGTGLAEETAPAPQPKCQTAEINPVTGHVFCIRPLGAPVDPPPPEAKPPCKPEDARGQWSWGPGCTPTPEM